MSKNSDIKNLSTKLPSILIAIPRCLIDHIQSIIIKRKPFTGLMKKAHALYLMKQTDY